MEQSRRDFTASNNRQKINQENLSKSSEGVTENFPNSGRLHLQTGVPSSGAAAFDGDDPYPSLSGYHDYEPQLEFDDAELLERKPEEENEEDIPSVALSASVSRTGRLDSPMSDGTIDEDFSLAFAREVEVAGQLGSPTTPMVSQSNNVVEDYSDIEKHGIVEVVGDDKGGRKIIMVSACMLPPNKELDNQKFLRYLKVTLDRYVDIDYTIVYFHHGLKTSNKPPLSWLWGLYKVLDRRYKKNLKSLYIVHPTSFIRVVYNFFKPIISAKFGRKIQYVNHLSELSQHMNINSLPIPKPVRDYDRQQTKMISAASNSNLSMSSWHPLQQFGVTLEWILDNQHCSLPPIMVQCIDFLKHPDCLDTEGIFRRAANAGTVKELVKKVNQGENISFSTNDVIIATVLLKTFFRELSHPILTYQLFESILHFSDVPRDSRLNYCQELVIKKLPDQNYVVLKYLMEFLCLVTDRCDMNKMTAANLAVVFGPNLAWPNDKQMSLSFIGPINTFTQFLIDNMYEVFII